MYDWYRLLVDKYLGILRYKLTHFVSVVPIYSHTLQRIPYHLSIVNIITG